MSEDKKTLIIEDKVVEFTNEPNLLEVIRKAGMNVPTFCYRPDLTQFGACRMCVIENERGGIEAACSTVPRDGMRVKTNTPVLQKHRKMILELLLVSFVVFYRKSKVQGI